MIADDELRTIFKTVSDERLQKLEDGLLSLEKCSDDSEKLEELLREAHSLKGDANMLGVKDIGTLSHQFEDVLGHIKRGELTFTSSLGDRLYQGIDVIRKLVHEAVTGEPSGIDVFRAMAHLMGANPDYQVAESVEAVPPAPAPEEGTPSLVVNFPLEGNESTPDPVPPSNATENGIHYLLPHRHPLSL